MTEPRPRRRLRRLGVLCVVIAVVAATLAFVRMAASGDPCHAVPATQCDRLFADFGLPSLATTNDGTRLGVYDNGGNTAGLSVVDSQLIHGAPFTPNAAGYLEARLPVPVRRIGAIASFHSGLPGAIGLLSWANSLVASRANGPSGPLPNGSMHFTATNTNWIFSVWDAAKNTTDTLLRGPLSLAADGTEYTFEVVRDRDTVTVRLPDGTAQSVTDPRIAQWAGPWACWELYEFDATRTPATIDAIWAS
jgi:hypothetical protein